MKKILALSAALLMQSTIVGGVNAQPINENPLSDPRVRQAIAYAIDMDTVVETLFEGRAIKAVGLLPNGPNKPDDLNPYDYDPEKARELLAEADWDSSYELDVAFYYNDQITADFMAAVQAYLSDVGISMNYRLVEGDVGSQISTMPVDPEVGPSTVQYDMLYGARAALALQEYYNRFAYGRMPMIPNIPEMNELVEKANSTTDPEVQREAYFAMERLVNEQAYILPLYYQQLYSFDSNRLNRPADSYGNEQYNYDWDVLNWTIEPNDDGEAVMHTNNGPTTFFEVPWQNLGIWAASKFAFDTLLTADGDLTPTDGELAESYEVSDDGMTVTLNMRQGALWHDGSPITAEDVAWSLGAAAKFPVTHPVIGNTVKSLEGAQAFIDGEADSIEGISVDGDTVTLEFATLDPNVLLALSQFAPLPSEQLSGTDPIELQQSEFWQKPIGSGPFMIEEVAMNDFTTFVPFEDYWGGVAKIDQIVAFPSYDGDPNLLRNASAGRADFGYTKNTSDVEGLEDMEHMTVHAIDIPYTRMFWINQFPHE